MEQREGWRPPPNLHTLNIPLDPCQDSQAAARRSQLRFSHPPASIPAWLTPGGPPKPLPPPLAHKLDKKFRSPAGRLATGWLPRMQSEKRLRGNTFCVDPDSGADSHESRQTRKWLQIRHSRPTKAADASSARRPPARPPPCSPKPQAATEDGQAGSSYFQGKMPRAIKIASSN
ncbi:hypothetical protein ABVT39_001374 [Epinephelus coioides]